MTLDDVQITETPTGFVADVPELNTGPRTPNDIVYGKFWGLSRAEYEKYLAWCQEIHAEQGGVIGGSITFHITPTSVGEFITATYRALKLNSNGRPVIKRNGKSGRIRYKMITRKLIIREP